ncbi:MAG: serine/threonine protein kinase [Bacteroidetes bacterium HGW-Bacteroidetes-2]|nr:MAG: serine/threonine protein kinase [Bacteroidetes bacterium HGW-Bacteroidetes-2]
MNFIQFLFTKTFLKQLALAMVVIVVFVFLIMFWLKFTTNHDQQIEVPNLAKLTLDKVEDKLNALDLRLEILDSANYNPAFPKFSVIEQIPAPGKFVKENRKIYIILNPSGYRKIEIPELIGKTQRQVEPFLRALGFEIGTISYRPHISDNVLEMRYKGEKLEAGTTLEITSVIDLIVGDAKDTYREEGESIDSLDIKEDILINTDEFND